MPRRRSPDGAPAAAQRRGGTTLTPTSGSPPSGAEKGAEPHLLNPASAAQETLHTPASATVALSQEAVCVATTSRIRRPACGRVQPSPSETISGTPATVADLSNHF